MIIRGMVIDNLVCSANNNKPYFFAKYKSQFFLNPSQLINSNSMVSDITFGMQSFKYNFCF